MSTDARVLLKPPRVVRCLAEGGDPDLNTVGREDGAIRGPADDGRVALVAQDDIAAAVAMLREPTAHAGRAYDLTGPEELALAEVAAVLSAVSGRAVLHVPATVEEALAPRAFYGGADWQVEARVSMHTAIAAGEMAGVSPAARPGRAPGAHAGAGAARTGLTPGV
jgi:uncharacterized protein YbjT (DUF2867 family)